MNDVPPGTLSPATLSTRTQRRGLPVALAGEAVAVGHEPLHGHAGQLPQRGEVLEVRRERAAARGLEHPAQAELDGGGVPQRVVALAPAAQLGDHVVEVLVLGDQRVDVGVRAVVDGVGQVGDGVAVDGDAPAPLRLGPVPLGHGDVAHGVAEAGQPQRAGLGPRARRARPDADALLHPGVAHVPGDGLADHAEPGLHVPELPVAVGGLVEVHEVHVDRLPRQRRRWPGCAGAAAACAARRARRSTSGPG